MPFLRRSRTACPLLGALVVLALASGHAAAQNDVGGASALFRAAPVPNVVDGVVFESGNWEPMLPAADAGDSWGNHRAVVELAGASGLVVRVVIPWRRHDADPAAKSIVVVNAATGLPVNSLALNVSGMSGEVVFEPEAGADTYHVYYMPWRSTGGYYPTVTYPSDMNTSDTAWVTQARLLPMESLPRATTTRVQSVNEFHSFFPMEVIASPAETAAVLRSGGGWALFSEHRDYSIRMSGFIPQHWVGREGATLHSQALRDESFAWQVGVAGDTPLDSLDIRFEGFPDDVTDELVCFNCGGIDEFGRSFTKAVSVPRGSVQPLWFGWMVPPNQPVGMISGEVVIQPRGMAAKRIGITIDVQPGTAVNHGYDEPELMTRLPWLNSTVGTDPDFVIPPFTPVAVNGRSLSILGRAVQLSSSGLPSQIDSYFTPEGTTLSETADPILASPLDLDVIMSGAPVQLASSPFVVLQEARGAATWSVSRHAAELEMQVEGRLEYDGMLDYRIRIVANRDLYLDDIRLPIALRPDAATYMLGLGQRGGLRPDTVQWKWKVENHQEGAWLGGISKGLQFLLRDDDYVRPLNTNFYQNQPLRMPKGWFNDGLGGIRIDETAGAVRATSYSGPRRLAAGDSLQFNVRFLITPVKPIDTDKHFRTRFVHRYVPVDSVKAWGGTVVNIHHANEINPYINYPFYGLEGQTAYIEEAHAKGIKVKLYNTVRELSYRAYELFALRSLGDEILNDGEGGGHSWLQEHLGSGYHAAWHAVSVDDAAILNKGTSRWTNYYIEGIRWLAAHQKIDGLYLDDIAFSRETVKRIVGVLSAERNEVVIDLHSANQFNERDGFTNSAMLYMEHFPFISRLWFGEYFDYNAGPDYWMTEVSGLPFGLMGEMLQDGGHAYRGLLYGMTSRFWGETDPRPVWHMMDEFGIEDSKMLGYWLPEPAVSTDNAKVIASTYVREDRVLIVLASWSDEDAPVHVTLDPSVLPGWAAATASTPYVDGLQGARDVDLSRVMVPANQGLYIVLDRE